MHPYSIQAQQLQSNSNRPSAGSRENEEDDGFFGEKYKLLWQTVMQPKRSYFNRELLGSKQRRVGPDVVYHREDSSARNERGELIEYTFYRLKRENDELFVPDKRCLLYLHSHGGNRLEGFSLLQWAAKLGTNLCLFDFRACGYSEGEYSTLGMLEHLDCQAVVEDLKVHKGVNRFIVWGRSMGAVAGLIFTSQHQSSVDFLVLDSPFSDMETMVKDMGNGIIKFGEYISTFLFGLIKDEFRKRVKVDPTDFKPIDACKVCETPCIFTVGVSDKLVLPDRVNEMCDEYAGNRKRVFYLEGDHTSPRSQADHAKIISKIQEHFDKPFSKLDFDRDSEAYPIKSMGPIRSLKQASSPNKDPNNMLAGQYLSGKPNQFNSSLNQGNQNSVKRITLARELKEKEILEKRKHYLGSAVVPGSLNQDPELQRSQVEATWLHNLETRKGVPNHRPDIFKRNDSKDTLDLNHWSRVDSSTIVKGPNHFYVNPRSQNLFLKPSPIKVSHTSIPMINTSQLNEHQHNPKSGPNYLIFDSSKSRETSTNNSTTNMMAHGAKRQSLGALVTSSGLNTMSIRPTTTSIDKNFTNRFTPQPANQFQTHQTQAGTDPFRQSLNSTQDYRSPGGSQTNISITNGSQKPMMFQNYIQAMRREAHDQSGPVGMGAHQTNLQNGARQGAPRMVFAHSATNFHPASGRNDHNVQQPTENAYRPTEYSQGVAQTTVSQQYASPSQYQPQQVNYSPQVTNNHRTGLMTMTSSQYRDASTDKTYSTMIQGGNLQSSQPSQGSTSNRLHEQPRGSIFHRYSGQPAPSQPVYFSSALANTSSQMAPPTQIQRSVGGYVNTSQLTDVRRLDGYQSSQSWMQQPAKRPFVSSYSNATTHYPAN